MSRRIVEASCVRMAWLSASAAQAQTLWVGSWFSVLEASRRSAHSFTLAKLPGGGLRYDDGGEVLLLAPGRRPTHEPFQPAAAMAVASGQQSTDSQGKIHDAGNMMFDHDRIQGCERFC